jgi:hypothetical protein
MSFKKYIVLLLGCFPLLLSAQVNAVEFGKNKIQYKKFKWKFYEGENFITYVNQGGTELGKFISQMAEDELQEIENFMESGIQGKVNIICYNSYDEYKQSNVGHGLTLQNANGVTILPNNKMVVYFDGNHSNLKNQIRHGIAQVILNNLLFGSDIGEVAGNQALLDLPKWITDGYISYAAERWNTEKDDDLRNAMLDGDYKSFYHFAFAQPNLAGHSFWYYIAEKYKPESVTYFLYLARINKSLNAASLKVCKMKLKDLLKDFMEYEQDKYYSDIRRRRNAPKGNIVADESVLKEDLYRFNVNPNPKNKDYIVVAFKKGFFSVKYVEDYEPITIMKRGVRTHNKDINPNYPILAWDVKGTKFLCIYWEKGKLKMFVYDVLAKFKRNQQEITGVDQILDANYNLDGNSLILSAVKNGQTDIYTYKIEEQKLTQITNDVYDDLNPTMVNFPNRTAFIYSSNRPGVDAPNNDTVQPSQNRFNIFLVDYFNNSPKKQITQLTNLKFGNAKFPMQYNTNHFSFVSDENGVGNRWAGFFTTARTGLDTLYFVGDEILRNPSAKEMDSSLIAWQKQEPDSISYFQVYKDSTYTFPITNYQTSLIETRTAGNNNQLSEMRRDGSDKLLYKLKINEEALYKRNITAPPTVYMKKIMEADRIKRGIANTNSKIKTDGLNKEDNDFFENTFKDEKQDTNIKRDNEVSIASNRYKARLFSMPQPKFQVDNLGAGVSNGIMINRFQPYGGGFGPIFMNSMGRGVNLNFRVGTKDVFEDYKITGAFSMGTNLRDKEILIDFQNLKRKVDWGVSYYRSNNSRYVLPVTGVDVFNATLVSNVYQANMSYPIDEVKSIRVTGNIRRDRLSVKPISANSGNGNPIGLLIPELDLYNVQGKIEYVHDNTLSPAMNIWEGMRFKVYADIIAPGADKKFVPNQETFNIGVDFRHYLPIYRNCIWAVRGAADFSWGSRKIIYYLGGVDGWIGPRFNDRNTPAADQTYAFQTLAVNMRGYNQNIANGNNAVVINSEIRLPVFSTFFNKPVNNAFLRNLQLVQFLDLGTAWNGKYNGIKRPEEVYFNGSTSTNITVRIDAGGLGPFAGGYGFGARSTLLGYFLKFDMAWPMKGIFVGKPIAYFALGLDF